MKSLAVAFIFALTFVGCADVPTAPTATPIPKPVLFKNEASLNVINPVSGSSLGLGDSFSVAITEEVTDISLYRGLAIMRDDGEVYIETVGCCGGRPGVKYPASFNFYLRNDLYNFSKGHKINAVYVLGYNGLLKIGGIRGTVDWEKVIYKQDFYLGYEVR